MSPETEVVGDRVRRLRGVEGIVVKALAFGAIVLIIALVVRAANRQADRIAASEERAEIGRATVVRVESNNSSLRTTAGVASGYDVTLDVTVPGRPPQQVTVPWYVRPLAAPLVQPGEELEVLVDPLADGLVYAHHPEIETDTTFVVDRLKTAGS
jgi:hypothetical protein